MENLNKAQQLLDDADVVIVTAGNKMAKNEGLDLLGTENFEQDFPESASKYHVNSIGAALDHKFDSWAEQWLFWSQLIEKYSLNYVPSPAMKKLRELIGEKKFFIATSTFGHFFEQADFNKNRIFNAFGDWTVMQCSSGVNHGAKSDQEVVRQILTAHQGDQDITKLVPKCEQCGQPMEIHMPLNEHFYPDTDANTRFRWFLTGNEEEKVVFLELGVDETSPQLFEPIIRLVQQFPQWTYVAADYHQEMLPLDIQDKSAAVNADAASLLQALVTD